MGDSKQKNNELDILSNVINDTQDMYDDFMRLVDIFGRNNKLSNDAEHFLELLRAQDEKEFIDAWIDLLRWYPPLYGPNGDAAAEALKGLVDNIKQHNEIIGDMLGWLDPLNDDSNPDKPSDPNNGIPGDGGDKDNPSSGGDSAPSPLNPPPIPRDSLILDIDKDGFISTIALDDSYHVAVNNKEFNLEIEVA